MANTRLTRTAGTPTLNTKFTISVWVKRASLGADQFIMDGVQDSSNRFKFAFQSANKLEIWNSHSGSDTFAINTNRVFRDTSAWMHIVLSVDTTDGTAGDRVKLYINGVRETSFSSSTNPSQNDANNVINESGAGVHIGDYNGGNNAFSGCMSHFHFCDGTALAPTVFGETDSTTGEWKIKTSPSFTLGNNGFTILKDGNTITDQSSNSNNFSLGSGTLTKTEDCPSNVFPIFNGMYCPKSSTDAGAFLNGGTTTGGSPSDISSIASMGVRSGKYYWEVKMQNAANTRSCGVVRSDSTSVHSAGIYPGGNGNASIWTVAYNCGNGYVQKNDNGTQTQQGSLATLTTGDILGIALNLTDYEIKWYKNGTLVTTTSISADWVAYGEFLLPCNRTDGSQFVQYNFGNGHFASTAVSSAGSNASGIGIFEYDVPAGFTALSTKGLNE